ncbi:MAG: hypothetical protein ACYDEV_00330 [Acidiferrobacter sp.]
MTSSTHVKEDGIRTGFIRQRRNLIAISLALLFVEASELSVKTLDIFGSQLAIHKQSIVTAALWFAYAYWLWRYYVYFHDIGDKGFRKASHACLSRLLDRWRKKKFESDRAWRVALVNKADDQWVKKSSSDADLQGTLYTPRDWRLLDVSPIGMGGFREIPVQSRLVLWDICDSKHVMVADVNPQFSITGLDAIVLNSLAGLDVLARTRIFSEYYLPYLIALAPPLYVLYQMSVR